MHMISRDSPGLYLTAVAKDRLPVFRSEAVKVITCKALDEARKSGDFAIYAYVVMPDHLHAVTDGARLPSEVLRFIKGVISRRVINYLKEGGFRASLEKLRHESKAQNYKYSLWEHHSNCLHLTSEGVFMQKVNYIHQNPVRAGLVQRAEDYRWSSVRCWKKCAAEEEPLTVNVERIAWRQAEA